MVLPVTPGQVAPPLDPPAHCATHGGCSSRPETQNALPVEDPVAGGATPRCPAVEPPAVTPPDDDPETVEPPPAPRPDGRLPGPTPGCCAGGSAPGDEDATGGCDPNWPPSCVPGVAPLEGATITSTIWAATSSANGA